MLDLANSCIFCVKYSKVAIIDRKDGRERAVALSSISAVNHELRLCQHKQSEIRLGEVAVQSGCNQAAAAAGVGVATVAAMRALWSLIFLAWALRSASF